MAITDSVQALRVSALSKHREHVFWLGPLCMASIGSEASPGKIRSQPSGLRAATIVYGKAL
ncbi:hypothetical protein PAL_GLEAN10001163 [Pteropus alecto]|uniref:Uncharacterized protein n=1 Tax=Pteropus alecto TaxID=9402 RepID=L5KA65_PTEAL|nr:hypothetical protein PAL_GLEAN10001163 [Pteropus alecto]